MTETTSETPVLDLLASMTADSMSASTLDAETFMLVRIAALVAVDAPSVSYLMNLAVAGELDIDSDRIRGVLAAVAPIVGTPRVAARYRKDRRGARCRARDRGARGGSRGDGKCGKWMIVEALRRAEALDVFRAMTVRGGAG